MNAKEGIIGLSSYSTLSRASLVRRGIRRRSPVAQLIRFVSFVLLQRNTIYLGMSGRCGEAISAKRGIYHGMG